MLFLGLSEAAALARAGERDAHVLIAALAREVGATPLARLDYAAVVDDATFTAARRDRPPRPRDRGGAVPVGTAHRQPRTAGGDVSDASGTPVLDRITIMPVVMQALLDDGARPSGDPEEVGVGRVVARSAGTLAGMPVAKEAFGRMGVRCRASVSEGAPIVDGDQVAELGGPVAAMRGAAPTALRVPLLVLRGGVGTPRTRARGPVRRLRPRPAVVGAGPGGPRWTVVRDCEI